MYRGGYTYIMTNAHHTTLYIGVTSDLKKRAWEHKNHIFKNSFTDKYNIEKLVYYEGFDKIEDAIGREKEIKKYRREKKDALINARNPDWKDLWQDVNRW